MKIKTCLAAGGRANNLATPNPTREQGSETWRPLQFRISLSVVLWQVDQFPGSEFPLILGGDF